jgi:hypothetical protein
MLVKLTTDYILQQNLECRLIRSIVFVDIVTTRNKVVRRQARSNADARWVINLNSLVQKTDMIFHINL